MTQHVLPDSQESALFGEDVYSDIQNEIGDEINGITFFPEDEEQKYTNPLLPPNPYLVEPRTPVPVKDEFEGLLHFDFAISNLPGKNWVFSQKLKKVFINMEETLPIQFKWDPPFHPNLHVRTAMVFSLDQYRSDPVQRCHNHMVPTSKHNQNVDINILKHVVRSDDTESLYEESNGHLSVITPCRTPQAGSLYVPMFFKFLCKNSCTSGMNRRPTELIFTLEDLYNNTVLGRRRLAIRVCSCPKRDKAKEEMEDPNIKSGSKKKRLLSAASPPPPGKRFLTTYNDNQIFTMQINVPGRDLFQAVLKSAYNTILGESIRTGQYDESFRPYLDQIVQQIQ